MPTTYEPIKQTDILAHQFNGWEDAQVIVRWIQGVFYVPQGYDHDLRRPDERNLDSKPSKNAPEYLVFINPNGDDVRVDLHTWIVIDSEDKTFMYSDKDFNSHYQKKPTFESKIMESLKPEKKS